LARGADDENAGTPAAEVARYFVDCVNGDVSGETFNVSSVHRTLQPGCIHGRPTMWTVVVAAVGFEAFTVDSPLMTGNRPDPPGRCRTDPATKSVVTQGKTGNDRHRRERPFS
jgi:hypothetical protein